MGWAHGFEAGTRAARSWMDTYENAKLKNDLADYGNVEPTQVASGEEAYNAANQAWQNQRNAAQTDAERAQVDADYKPTLDAVGLQRNRAAGWMVQVPGGRTVSQEGEFSPAQLAGLRAEGMARAYIKNGMAPEALQMTSAAQQLAKGEYDLKHAARVDKKEAKMEKWADEMEAATADPMGYLQKHVPQYNADVNDGRIAGMASTASGPVLNITDVASGKSASLPIDAETARNAARTMALHKYGALGPEEFAKVEEILLKRRGADQKDRELGITEQYRKDWNQAQIRHDKTTRRGQDIQASLAKTRTLYGTDESGTPWALTNDGRMEPYQMPEGADGKPRPFPKMVGGKAAKELTAADMKALDELFNANVNIKGLTPEQATAARRSYVDSLMPGAGARMYPLSGTDKLAAMPGGADPFAKRTGIAAPKPTALWDPARSVGRGGGHQTEPLPETPAAPERPYVLPGIPRGFDSDGKPYW